MESNGSGSATTGNFGSSGVLNMSKLKAICFSGDLLFDLLSLHFNPVLNLNQIELDTFVRWIYPPFLIVEKTNKKSKAFFSNNWEHINNGQLKFYLND